jgi:transketolase
VNINALKSKKQECLKEILRLYKKANAGHIGASLSCLDILVYLYFYRMNKNDKFVLSKGHAALSLYVVLAKSGQFDEKLLDTFYKDGTLLAAHPQCNRKLNGIPFGTGSLGHGLSLASGFALSNKFTNKRNNVYCVISEGDCNEGSTWEAALFAAQHKLKNLFVIIDNNNLQGFGSSEEVLNLEPLAEKWQAFNFEVSIAENGNDFNSIHSSFENFNNAISDKPKCVIAKTVKGHGISFMENKLEWHYLPMTDEQYLRALEEIERN